LKKKKKKHAGKAVGQGESRRRRRGETALPKPNLTASLIKKNQKRNWKRKRTSKKKKKSLSKKKAGRAGKGPRVHCTGGGKGANMEVV